MVHDRAALVTLRIRTHIRRPGRMSGTPGSRCGIAMQVLRHARFSVTMEIYTQVSSKATRDALKRLGDSLGR